MNNEAQILEKLDRLCSLLEDKVTDHDDRIAKLEERLESALGAMKDLRANAHRQQASIETLTARVRELAKTDAVWKSRDKREVAIDRDAAYSVFRELGYGHSEGLKALDGAEILKRDPRHLTRNVRRGNKIIRAVVIFDD